MDVALARKIPQRSMVINNVKIKNEKLVSQLMIVSNLNTLPVILATVLEKQQTRWSSVAGEAMFRYLVSQSD